MRTTLILTALLLATASGQAGLVQDQLYQACDLAAGDDAAMQFCTLQADADEPGDAHDDCNDAAVGVSIDTSGSFTGVLFPAEDREDWYDGTVATTGGIGIELEPSGLVSPLVDLYLEVLETDCSTDSDGGGTSPASRVSDLEYEMPGATSGTSVRLGVVSNGATLDVGSVSIVIPLMCDPVCMGKLLDDTVLEPLQYVVKFSSI
ncbi:MAG: hypothetical protein ACPGQL_10720 [Thermoplasmatota archaeon]